MVALHDNKLNGILADEMGLGKTIQVSKSHMTETCCLVLCTAPALLPVGSIVWLILAST